MKRNNEAPSACTWERKSLVCVCVVMLQDPVPFWTSPFGRRLHPHVSPVVIACPCPEGATVARLPTWWSWCRKAMTAAYHEAHVRAADVEMLDCEYLDQQAYFDQPILVSVRCMASPFTPVGCCCASSCTWACRLM
jgi:hypothetical protein